MCALLDASIRHERAPVCGFEVRCIIMSRTLKRVHVRYTHPMIVMLALKGRASTLPLLRYERMSTCLPSP